MAPERSMELDAAGLKAMAHPLRVQIVRVLTLRKKASVTSLADELDETTGAISYHLRQLAKHGFVEQVDPDSQQHGVGRRQRWWAMAVDWIHMSGFDFLADEDTREAATFVLREISADRSRRLANWFATSAQWSEGWQRASSDADGFVELNQKQTRALADDMSAVFAKYRAMKPGRGARMIDVQYAVFPSDDGGRG